MFWLPLMTGVINAVFILDLIVTLSTGDSLASLLVDASHNTVAQTIVGSIPTDPAVFWIVSGFVLMLVCSIECVLIYLAFYAGDDRVRAGTGFDSGSAGTGGWRR